MSLINPGVVDVDFAAIRADLGIPGAFPADVLAEAAQLQAPTDARRDATDLPFVTIDPPGSMDLDQAVLLTAKGDGYRVYYAIADVAAYLTPGDLIDVESRRRGQTYYSPDLSTPLHPRALSEGLASLLPDQVRAAVLWTFELDARGETTSVQIERARIRSVAKLDYPGVQADFDAGRPHPSIALLATVGPLRIALARARHAITLNLPDVEVVRGPDGQWTLSHAAGLPVEAWNAEISLLTGLSAARIMLDHGVGLIRTLPAPTAEVVHQLRVETQAFGIPWLADAPPGDVIATLDPSRPVDAAFLADARKLLRGAGYAAFDGRAPAEAFHAGLGAPYAHVTAPLRRLGDRFATEVCLAQSQGRPIPDWAREALPAVATVMTRTDRIAHDLERRCEEAVTAFLLHGREGQRFEGTVVQIDKGGNATIALDNPPIEARAAAAGLREGTRVAVRLVSVAPGDILVAPVDERPTPAH